MRVFVPFDATVPKTRLDPVLSSDERRAFAGAMLTDVLEAIEDAGGDPTVVATEPIDVSVPTIVDGRSLDDDLNERLEALARPVAIVMADLALVTPDALDRLFGTDGDVVLAPGLGGGTNAIVVRHPDFRVDYHDGSIRDHRRIAHDVGATLSEVDSFRLATDVDEPGDLAEVLLHGQGRAVAWLRDRGFELAIESGRVGVER